MEQYEDVELQVEPDDGRAGVEALLAKVRKAWAPPTEEEVRVLRETPPFAIEHPDPVALAVEPALMPMCPARLSPEEFAALQDAAAGTLADHAILARAFARAGRPLPPEASSRDCRRLAKKALARLGQEA